jgi:NAD(P)-dependent dehydrogenase (short-subunit alcohol dehydrogenase family)
MTARSVLITGCSTGIGRACALRLHNAGWCVFAGVRREADADALSSEGLRPVILDVTDEASIREAMTTMAAGDGADALDGLVNNAGIAVPGPVEMLSSESLRSQLEVNLVGLAAVTRACLPMLRKAQGRIVNMSSVSGRVAYPFLGAYAASKFGVEALSDALRVELRPWGIRVILVEPGSVRTPIWDKGQTGYDELRAGTQDEKWALYGDTITRFAEMTRQAGEQGMAADGVAALVEKALTARRPRARYMPGIGIRIGLKIARMMPTRLWDWMVARKLGF